MLWDDLCFPSICLSFIKCDYMTHLLRRNQFHWVLSTASRAVHTLGGVLQGDYYTCANLSASKWPKRFMGTEQCRAGSISYFTLSAVDLGQLSGMRV